MASFSQASEWAETKQILAELRQCYQGTAGEVDDAKLVGEIKAQNAKASRVIEERKANTKQVIQALEETHTEISRALAEDGAERIVGLQQQRVAGMEGVRALRERENQCTKAVDTVKKDNFELRQDLEHNSQREVVDVPQIKHALSLYSNITNIKWDYASAEEQCAGTIVDPVSCRVQRFAIDSSACSPYELADLLWEHIGSS